MFSLKSIEFIFMFAFSANTLCVWAQTQCESTQLNGVNGFCVYYGFGNCCNGNTVSGNICNNNGMGCCYGQFNCSYVHPCPNINSRDSWRNRNSLRPLNPVYNPDHVFIHHTDDQKATCTSQSDCAYRVRAMQSVHELTNGWSDIAWNFLIGGDGSIYEGIGWDKEGFHTNNYNSISLGIAFIGNFDVNSPTDTMMNSLYNLLRCGFETGHLSRSFRIHGHRDVNPATTCPGANVYTRLFQFPNYTPN